MLIKKIHMAAVGNDLAGKILQHRLIGQITYIAIIGEQIDDADPRPLLLKFLGNGPADTPCSAGNDGNFVFKHGTVLLLVC